MQTNEATALRIELLIPFRLRVVRVGIATTLLVLPALAAFPLLPSHGSINLPTYRAVVVAAVLGVAVVSMLPWARMFDSNLGILAMYLWSFVDIMLITVAIGATGGGDSELFLLYGLTTLFLISYPRSAQLALAGLSLASYVVVVWATGWTIGPGVFVMRISVLAGLGLMAVFLTSEVRREIEGHALAQEESRRRAAQLAIVARAARSMSSLDPEHILAAVVEAVGDLGFEARGIAELEPGGGRYQIRHGRGLPGGFTAGPRESSRGMVAEVLRTRVAVVVEDYGSFEGAIPVLRAAGIRAVMASPVWLGSKLAAVLIGGTRRAMSLSRHDVDAFELLAAQAGAALDVARRFDEQQRAVERLAELDRMKNEFVSMVSHELRTPLTVIEGMGKTLIQQWGELNDATRLELLSRLNTNTEALEGLIATLLDFAQFQERGPSLRVERVDMATLLRDAVGRLETLFWSRRVVVEVEPALPVMVDTVLMDRVVENLLSNAAKHTPEDSTIRVEARRRDGLVRVRVQDDGPGIPAHELPRLGQRFFRGGDPNSRKTKGFGLGLALVREILERHGADLHVESDPAGGGATFWFEVPLDPATTGEPSTRETASPPAAGDLVARVAGGAAQP